MEEELFIGLASGAICLPVIFAVVYALKLLVEWMFLGKELETKTKHLLIGLGVPVLSIPVAFIIPGVLNFCKFDFGSGCNVVSDGVFSCLLYTSPSPRDRQKSRMPSSA